MANLHTTTERPAAYYDRPLVSIFPVLEVNGEYATFIVEIVNHDTDECETRVMRRDYQINEFYCDVEWMIPELQLELYESGYQLPYVHRWCVNGKTSYGHDLP
jgi:hypothetical protein